MIFFWFFGLKFSESDSVPIVSFRRTQTKKRHQQYSRAGRPTSPIMIIALYVKGDRDVLELCCVLLHPIIKGYEKSDGARQRPGVQENQRTTSARCVNRNSILPLQLLIPIFNETLIKMISDNGLTSVNPAAQREPRACITLTPPHAKRRRQEGGKSGNHDGGEDNHGSKSSRCEHDTVMPFILIYTADAPRERK